MATKLIVDEGRVSCPIRGDVDIDLCAACPYLDALEHRGQADVLRCSPPRPQLTHTPGTSADYYG